MFYNLVQLSKNQFWWACGCFIFWCCALRRSKLEELIKLNRPKYAAGKNELKNICHNCSDQILFWYDRPKIIKKPLKI